MSLWQRLFKKDQVAKPVARQPSRKEQYQRKVRLYSEILTVGNTALEFLAQMQVRLQGQDYFSPAYISLNCAIVLDHTRRVIDLLGKFTGDQSLELAEKFSHLADRINQEITGTLRQESAAPALPFERHILSGPELLASGVAYTAKEADLTEALTIKAVWGWWPAVQDGKVPARRYRVAHGQVTEYTLPEAGLQEQWLTYHPEQGFVMEPLPPGLQEQPCLQEEEALKIAEYHRLLKTYYPDLQEVKWGLGPQREVLILRSLAPAGPSFQDTSGGQPVQQRVLFAHGLAIYPGLAAGPAFPVDADHLPDTKDVPEGVVLLANKPALSLAPLLDKAAALVVETGEPHNHLAFLARDRRVPTIFAIGEDTSHVPEGMNITVDTRHLQVSVGPPEIPARENEAGSGPPSLAAKLLARLSPWLFPLKAAESGQAITPGTCQSIHDLLYYASVARRQEMFCLSLHGEVGKKDAVNLVTGRLVPILVIDAGGGLSAESPTVTYEEVASFPFRAFLEGMMSIPWPKARPLDVKGFISVIGVTSTTPRAEDQLRKVSFALLSENYMNFSLCLGYHASTIEAYVGHNVDHNYIRFHYQGGAASIERRLRRLQLIGEILVQLGFSVSVQGDLLDALLAGDPAPRLLQNLKILGRLEVYTKQMDMVMSDDTVISGHVSEFLETHVAALSIA
ncbi:MAG: PEP/pyruvate-binding domain-containing protein [Syntrophobacterales bacterium]